METLNWLEYFQSHGLALEGDFQNTRDDLLRALKTQQIPEIIYLAWVQTEQPFPLLKDEFFTNYTASPEFWTQWKDRYPWDAGFLPLTHWEDILIVVGSALPPNLPTDFPYAFIYASYSKAEKIFNTYNSFEILKDHSVIKSPKEILIVAPKEIHVIAPKEIQVASPQKIQQPPSTEAQVSEPQLRSPLDIAVSALSSKIPFEPISLEHSNPNIVSFDSEESSAPKEVAEDSEENSEGNGESEENVIELDEGSKNSAIPEGFLNLNSTPPVLPSFAKTAPAGDLHFPPPPQDDELEAVTLQSTENPPAKQSPTESAAQLKAPNIILKAPEALPVTAPPLAKVSDENLAAEPLYGSYELLKKINFTEVKSQVQVIFTEFESEIENAFFGLVNPDDKKLQFIFRKKPDSDEMKIDEDAVILSQPNVCSIVLRTQKSFYGKPITNEANSNLFKMINDAKDPANLMIVPVILEDRVIGMVGFVSTAESYSLERLIKFEQKVQSQFRLSMGLTGTQIGRAS